MERDELTELSYITAIANLASIAEGGILSHRLAERVTHIDLAMTEIQDRRRGKRVPDVRRPRPRDIHEYAPLYICPRNPMLFKRRERHEEICVLRIDPAVLDLEHVVVTDGNAASDYTRFSAAPGGLAEVDADMTFAEYWTDPDVYSYWDRKRRKCAEVLVPDRVESRYIVGVYVSCTKAQKTCSDVPVPWPITVDPYLFFV